MQPNCSKSTESLYSTTSSKYSAGAVYTRPSNSQLRQPSKINIGTRSGDVKQRVLSARRLRMKTLQNQLADAQLHAAELAQENRILRTLHKRQDNALSKYENTNAELPQLLHSHAEEVRVWQTKCKNLQIQNKELAGKLKQKDSVILSITDQNKHLTQLNNDKNLEDRERLSERVRYLEQRLLEKDNEIKLMARKLQLEKKSFKNQLQSEHCKYKDLMSRLEKSKTELTGLPKIDPLGIADKLAKVSILPKAMKVRDKIGELKNHEELSNTSLENNGMEEERYFRDTINKTRNRISLVDSKITEENRDFKTKINKERKRSISSKSDEDIDSPSPITMRPTKLNLDKKKNDFDKSIKPKTIENAFEMNMDSLKEKYDEVSITSSETNLKEYTKWRNNISNLHNDEDYETENYKEYDYNNSFEDHDNEVDDDDDNYAVDMIESDPINNSDLVDIKKQIMNDYEDREKFLDTYCRDSSADALTYIKENEFKKPLNVDSKKKTKLLAALRAIDEKGSKDSA